MRHPDHRFEWTRANSKIGPIRLAQGTATLSNSVPSAKRTLRRALRVKWRCSADDPQSSRAFADRACGASGSGKSSFARKHFLPTEIVSSDTCRGLVSDDENSQTATDDAFDLLHYTIEKRLKRGRLTVVDATNVQAPARKKLIDIARKYHMLPTAIVFNMPEAVCLERNKSRPDRQFGPHVVKHQTRDLRQSLKWLRKEGFRHIHILGSAAEVDEAEISRENCTTTAKISTAV